jgi:hypothetical protein
VENETTFTFSAAEAVPRTNANIAAPSMEAFMNRTVATIRVNASVFCKISTFG